VGITNTDKASYGTRGVTDNELIGFKVLSEPSSSPYCVYVVQIVCGVYINAKKNRISGVINAVLSSQRFSELVQFLFFYEFNFKIFQRYKRVVCNNNENKLLICMVISIYNLYNTSIYIVK
jgi:hypothetical protein